MIELEELDRHFNTVLPDKMTPLGVGKIVLLTRYYSMVFEYIKIHLGMPYALS